MSGLDSKEEDLINKTLEEKGLEGVKSALINRIDKWKTEQLHIAVIGQAGVGKSSFINAIRNLTAEDIGAANVGVVETTGELKEYPHPSYPNLTFWDVPGVGTKRWPMGTYLKDIKFQQYDFYLILTATRFMELDIWLAQEVQKSGKKCFFVRTKIDIDVNNTKMTHPKTFHFDATIDEIRAYCKEQVMNIVEQTHELSLKDLPIFLISNAILHSQDFDFPKLKEKIIEDFPSLKQEAILFVLSGTQKILEHKKKMLEKRIPKVAILSAIGGLIPIPGLSVVVDMEILKSEVEFYRQQFGLDKTSLMHLDLTAEGRGWKAVRDLIQNHIDGASEVAESTLAMTVPIIGCLVSAGISYGITYATLHKFLKETAEKGFQLLELVNTAAKEQYGLD